MSDLKFTQEDKNRILDLKDMVNQQSKTINQLVERNNSQQRRIDELDKKLLKLSTSRDFNDIFRT